MNFTGRESIILNTIQKGIPCVSEPFRAIGEDSGIAESTVIETISSLKEKKVIRNISGIFEGKRLGYSMSLVAFEVPDSSADEAGAIISSHPGVSHNYLRNHRYNIWFTLAEESQSDFNKTVTLLASKCGARDYLVLKNERLLKIGVFLNMTDADDSPAAGSGRKEMGDDVAIDETAREAVLLLQNDLPLDSRPFSKLAERGKLIQTEDRLLLYLKRFLDAGIIRRYAAVLKHQNAGYRANAMTAWKSTESTDINLFLGNSAISHLYYRTIYPGRWEHPLFAMIHARSDDELKNIIDTLSAKSGINDYLSLSSLKEFKKSRVRYFSDEFNEWKRLNYD